MMQDYLNMDALRNLRDCALQRADEWGIRSHLMQVHQLLRWLFVPIAAIVAGWYFTRKSYQTWQNGIVIVTGAGSGIGLQTAQDLAKNRSYVVIAAVLSEEEKRRLTDLGIKNLTPVVADITKHDHVARFVQTVLERSQQSMMPIVAVVHNAAISRMVPAEFHPLDDVKHLFDTNFFGAVDLVQLLLPQLRETKGRLIFLSSFVTSVPTPLYSIYTASKAALEGFADALRREVAPFGISVSIIKPGFVQTEMAKEDGFAAVDNERVQQTYGRWYSKECKATYDAMVRKAEQPEVVAKEVIHAITSPYPKTRYYVSNVRGVPTRVLAGLTWLLPERVQDMCVANKGNK